MAAAETKFIEFKDGAILKSKTCLSADYHMTEYNEVAHSGVNKQE